MAEKVILVDKNNKEIGFEEKMKAHIECKLHRAFSIFVFNSKKELLLQRRAKSKYHCGGLWTNTCCSHPRPNEPLHKAVYRRLKEEMGFNCSLKEVCSFMYKAVLGKKLYEYEYDHVFIGKYEGDPNLNPEEADEWKWVSIDELKRDIIKNAEKYTPWFKIILEKYLDKI
ncbi:isopentenyl-diphosphate Delta-isomerase [bacterium BMS3Abin15]|nr:isopentenyl-diphosphate Delta-isomerase [bacterium BMS3Abin15]